MICVESQAVNHMNSAREYGSANNQNDSDIENKYEEQSNEDENTTAEVFVRLTDMVRRHYCGYLEKQLLENVQTWRENKSQPEPEAATDLQLKEQTALKECCRVLEDKALKACMHARRYQRSMLKIIAEVRRSTQEFRLEGQLRKLIATGEDPTISTEVAHRQKATQTDESLLCSNESSRGPVTDNDISLSLQQKIEMFQERLNQEAALKVAATHKECYKRASRHSTHNPSNHRLHVRHHQKHSRRSSNNSSKVSRCIELYENDGRTKPASNVTTVSMKHDAVRENTDSEAMPPPSCESAETTHNTIPAVNCPTVPQSAVDDDLLEQDDEIAKELAQLFSEEKSELEELLGLNTNSEIDDPQVRSVLEEIEKAPLSRELKLSTACSAGQHMGCSPEKQQRQTSPIKLNGALHISASPFVEFHDQTSLPHYRPSSSHSERPVKNLRHSLWPCELFMQRRRLTTSLSRLIEEDFRWHELIKWKFDMLFGEDSDDEFSTCSPSIELDEVLICSCIRRISPWMVKHLMKPMHDGLIANRYLFKKLAKRLAHSIVVENQYPGEWELRVKNQFF
ncbi:uncharacterized protein LOC118745467 [Rhagoletis pomonella]|uniref:uncharacterized protein LOC118745467 n=1 Tax=Rhagoletis pomonella TaxID=28610 RepID=UPI0017860564|nr:uncharacterized protein LOC118745467 [Rhagoletis pomonella]